MRNCKSNGPQKRIEEIGDRLYHKLFSYSRRCSKNMEKCYQNPMEDADQLCEALAAN
jgi:hypothetical protein